MLPLNSNIASAGVIGLSAIYLSIAAALVALSTTYLRSDNIFSIAGRVSVLPSTSM
jgi:hypothetical protein